MNLSTEYGFIDWTKEMATKGFPELQQLYAAHGKKDNVFLLRGEHFPHNYNAVTRSAFYTFLNRHFKLGHASTVIERDFEPLAREQLTVWDDSHLRFDSIFVVISSKSPEAPFDGRRYQA